jgi:YVTN family beta-propeller protein
MRPNRRRFGLPLILSVALAASVSCRSPKDAGSAPHAAGSPAAPKQVPVRVYVSNERSGDISVIDSATNQVVATIPVGKRPRGIHVSRDGRTVYVALSGSPIAGPNVRDEDLPPADKKADGIGAVDVSSGRFVEKIASGSDPEQFAISPDERSIYVSNEDEGQASVVDLASRKVAATFKVGTEPEGVGISPDGHRVYITSETANDVHVVDAATNKIVANFKTAQRPRSVAFVPDGSKGYVTCETAGVICAFDPATNKVTKEIHPPGEGARPMGIVVSPSGDRVYVTTGRGGAVAAIDTRSDEVVATLPGVGARPWGIGITPDGKTLYTANGPSDDVSVIDTETMKVVARVKAGTSPWGIAVAPPPPSPRTR